MVIYEYLNERFLSLGIVNKRDGLITLATVFEEKANTFNFNSVKKNELFFTKEVSLKNCTFIGPYINRYRVKYQEHFFSVLSESKHSVTLSIHEVVPPDIARNLGFQPRRWASGIKKVNRNKVTEIINITDKIAFFGPYGSGKLLPGENEMNQYLRSEVVFVLNEKDQKLLVKKDSYISDNDITEVWINKEELFIYNENKDPLKY